MRAVCYTVCACRLLWSRSQHATGELFLALKRNHEEPEPAAAALVGLTAEAAAAAVAAAAPTAAAAGGEGAAPATLTSAAAMSSAAAQVRVAAVRIYLLRAPVARAEPHTCAQSCCRPRHGVQCCCIRLHTQSYCHRPPACMCAHPACMCAHARPCAYPTVYRQLPCR